VDLKDGVQRITLNSIKKRNALSLAMLNELKHHFTNIDVNTRVVVIAHSGPVFSAGHDLKELVISSQIVVVNIIVKYFKGVLKL